VPLSVPSSSLPAAAARVLICDDSPVIRTAITRILEADPAIRVVARAGNGQAALDALKLHDIDVVVLDIEMPVMDGLTALPKLLAAEPGLRVIMASTLTTRGADIAMQALRLGAADYVPKPSAAIVAGDTRFGPELIEKVKGLARMRRHAKTPHAAAALPVPVQHAGIALRAAPRQPPLLLAIGSSTGGPNALFAVVQGLSPRVPVPIVLTQHMPATFTPILAEHIDRLGVLPCAEARDGMKLKPGHIALAPGDKHLIVQRDGTAFSVKLSDAPPENFCRPSVDPMLRSATACSDGRVLVVMLTGMGHDGLEGTRLVVNQGGAAIAQDEATSVVWGMPGAVARAGLAHAVLPLAQIGPKILTMLGIRA
jgi:two-component system chemotaxis response regulator CheB